MRKWLKRLLIACGILFVTISMLAIYLSPPKTVREWNLPDYAKDLPANFKEASDEFNRRILVRFQLPLSEEQLINDLKKDGFEIYPDDRFAHVERNGFPCSYSWIVIWITDANRYRACENTVYELRRAGE